MVNFMVVLNIPIVKGLDHMTKILVFECKAYNKSTHNQQEEMQEDRGAHQPFPTKKTQKFPFPKKK